MSSTVNYISNNYDFELTSGRLISPKSSGIYIEKNCLLKVLCRITIKSEINKRIKIGNRKFITTSNYEDSVDGYVSPGIEFENSSTFYYYRIGKFNKGIYLRPIASVNNSINNICDSCNLTVLALKEY